MWLAPALPKARIENFLHMEEAPVLAGLAGVAELLEVISISKGQLTAGQGRRPSRELSLLGLMLLLLVVVVVMHQHQRWFLAFDNRNTP